MLSTENFEKPIYSFCIFLFYFVMPHQHSLSNRKKDGSGAVTPRPIEIEEYDYVSDFLGVI